VLRASFSINECALHNYTPDGFRIGAQTVTGFKTRTRAENEHELPIELSQLLRSAKKSQFYRALKSLLCRAEQASTTPKLYGSVYSSRPQTTGTKTSTCAVFT
jgi:hypothetical protein